MQSAVNPNAATMANSIGSILAYDTAAIGAHATRLAAEAVIVNRVMLIDTVAIKALKAGVINPSTSESQGAFPRCGVKDSDGLGHENHGHVFHLFRVCHKSSRIPREQSGQMP